MNTLLASQGGNTAVGVRVKIPETKLQTATAGNQPIVAKSASLRVTTAKGRRRNIAGAPYYRGLHWDL